MWPIVLGFLRSYAPYVTFPVAAVVGYVGYKIEGLVSDKYTPYQDSVEQRRTDRLVAENVSRGRDATSVDTLREHKFVPRTVFERNVSPSLREGVGNDGNASS